MATTAPSVAASPTGASAAAPAAAATAKPAATSAPQTAASATAATGATAGAPTLKDVSTAKLGDKVTSYRMKLTFRDTSPGVKAENAVLTMTEEWVKDPPAQHLAIKGADETQAIEVIQIGKTSYVSFGGQWMKSDTEDSVKSTSDADLSAWMKDSDTKLVPAGSETVNGIKCQHYTYDVVVPFGTEKGVTVKAKGEVWIADEAPLTGIVVKEKAEAELVGRVAKPAAKGETGAMNLMDWTKASWEREISDVNKPITIKPPENVADLGAMLTPQATEAARTTPTARASGTPAAQTGTTGTPTARATQAAAVPQGTLTWTKSESDAEQNLYVVVMVSNTTGFAFGSSGESLRLSGGKWARFELAEAEGLTIADAKLVDGKSVWAVGDQGLILRFDGSKWTRFQSPTEEDLYAIGMSSDSEGWAAGSGGTLLRFANGSWKSVDPSPVDPSDSTSEIVMISASDGWIFGNGGQMLRLKGGTWVDVKSELDPGDDIVFATSVPGSKDVWALGYSMMWRYDGSKWASMDYPVTGNAFNSASFASATDGWAVGDSGTIIRWNGNSWAKWTSPSKEHLKAVAVAANGDAWIVGTGPMILKLNR
jgi:hypothetical protein